MFTCQYCSAKYISKVMCDKHQMQCEEYEKCPTLCKNCNSKITFKRRKDKFCNSSCAASYNNGNRTDEQLKAKNKSIQTTFNEKYENGYKRKPRPRKINKCLVCSEPSEHRKTCSKECLDIFFKNHGTNLLRKRRAAGEDFSFRRQSKLEKTFEKFLNDKGIHNNLHGYLKEIYVKNKYTLTGYYRLDFVFPKLKLVIEIDGKQHEKPAQIAHDVLRDYQIIERGWKVHRINYYEVNKPEILEQVYSQLLCSSS